MNSSNSIRTPTVEAGTTDSGGALSNKALQLPVAIRRRFAPPSGVRS
jgi:hypothetical protein